MKQNFLSKNVILGCLLVSQLSAVENYKKVVLASFPDENKAQNKFNQLINSIEDKIKSQKEKYPFNVVMRASGSHYIIAAEPFKYRKNANEVLKELKKDFPTAFINNNAKTFDENEIEPSNKTAIFEETEIVVTEKKVINTQDKETKIAKYTLEDMIREVIFTDPEIIERLYQYNAIMEDINISASSNLPTIDLVGKIGKKETKKDNTQKDRYNNSEITLSLVQNLFNGFGTTHAVNRDEARAKASFYKYLEVAQDKIYRAVEAYIKVIRYSEVIKIAKDNVRVHEETLLKIQDRYDKGFSTLSEVERVKGRLALSKSNYVSETNNLFDAKFNFHKSLGRIVPVESLVLPEFKNTIPKTLEHATDIAIHNNPSIMVANYDIKVTQESLQYSKRNDYPTLDIELERSRYNNLTGSSSGSQNDTSAMLVLRYNLYKGGADKAEHQKNISLLNYEYTHKNKLKRDVIESLGLSWSAHKMIAEQYKYQLEYRDLTAKTKSAYDEEFQLGRRTLIDLLDVQDEVNNIKIKVIHNSYDLLFSKYRIIDATGELYKTFANDLKEDYKKDKILAYSDQDNDKILDCEDQCDNSAIPETNIYGCEGINCIQIEEIEFDSVIKDDENQLDTSGVQNLWGVN